jgi:hypothetical protein
MSTSAVRDLQDHSNFDGVCETLQKRLWKRVCHTLQKSVDYTVCAPLKRGIHEVVAYPSVQSGFSDGAEHITGTLPSDVCASFEEITGNAVCAALKSVFSDTVCKVLQDAISTSMRNAAARWEHEVPFHVTPEALNISREEMIGNAVCAALKQVIADTVCKELNKAIAQSSAFVLGKHAGQAPPSSEDVRAGASIAEAGQLNLDGYKELNLDGYKELNLDGDQVLHTPKPDTNAKLCAYIEKRVKKEVCSQLQQLAASILCRKLKKAIREEIRQHPERCEECRDAERFVELTAGRALLTKKMGIMIVAFIAVAAVTIAAAAPGSPIHIGPATTTLSLYSPASSIGAGESLSLTGALRRSGGSGLGGYVVELQRQSGGTWEALNSTKTLSDGSFTFELRRASASASLLGARNGTREMSYESNINATQHLNVFQTPSQAIVLQAVTPTATIVLDEGTHYINSAITLDVETNLPLKSGDPVTYGWSVTGPSGSVTLSDSAAKNPSFTPDVLGDYSVQLTVTEKLVGAEFEPFYNIATASKTISVVKVSDSETPQATIVVSDQSHYVNDTIQLGVTTNMPLQSGMIEYAWNVIDPSGNTAVLSAKGAKDPTFTPGEPGSYTIQLTVRESVLSPKAVGSYNVVGEANDTKTISVQRKTEPGATIATLSPMPSSSGIPSGSNEVPSGRANVTIPKDASSSPGGHNYQAVFHGSADCAACTSARILINDNSSTQSAVAETSSVSALVSALLRLD